MGFGQLIPLKKVRQPAEFVGKIILSKSKVEINDGIDPVVCLPEVSQSHKMKDDVEEIGTDSDEIILDEKTDSPEKVYRRQGQLYLCDNDACEAKFMTSRGVLNHISREFCVVRTRKRSPTGEFKYRWFKRNGMKENEAIKAKGRYFMSHLQDLIDIEVPASLQLIPTGIEDDMSNGFALHQSQSHAQFAPERVAFIKSLFDEGQRTGNKIQHEIMLQKMRDSKIDGKKQFKPEEVFTLQQIKSLCSRMFAKIKNASTPEEEEDQRAEVEEAEEAYNLMMENDVKLKIRQKLEELPDTDLTVCPMHVIDFSFITV